MAARPSSPSILPLTSVRFFAALGVVMHHCGAALIPVGIWPLHRMLERGYVGVTLFFVLSGFVLTLNYADRERVPFRSFMQARFARVYPLYALTLGLALPFFLRDSLIAAGRDSAGWIVEFVAILVLCATLLQAWFPLQAAVLNPSAWSLSAEAFFYAVFPSWMNKPALRRFLERPLSSILLLWFVGTAMTLVWVWAFPSLRFEPGLSREDLFKAFLIAFNPLLRLPEFLIGCVLGILHMRGGIRWKGWTAILFSLVIILPAMMLPPHGSMDIILHNTLMAPAFGLMILGLASLPEQRTGILSASWLVFLGEASYGLYILHVPIRDWFDWSMIHFNVDLSPVHQSLVLIAICIAAASASYRWIEVPSRRWIRGRIS